LSESQKERNYENAKSHVGFDWDDVFVCRHSVGAAGFRPITIAAQTSRITETIRGYTLRREIP
jgi:hypothetical protein